MRHAFLLSLVMGTTWLVLSGYFIGMILTFGLISIVFVVWMTKRLAILDDETVPYLNIVKTCKYYFWLFIEINFSAPVGTESIDSQPCVKVE